MSEIYNILEEVKRSQRESNDPAGYFELDLLRYCKNEPRFLYPGKLYVFRYFPKFKNDKPVLHDTFPYIMSLGPDTIDQERFYGINMHIMPYKIRLQVFSFIYNRFKDIIGSQIAKFPGIEDALRQDYIKEVNAGLITKTPFSINIKQCIHRYSLKYMKDCKCINYNLAHYMLQSEANYFVNGTIRDAQQKFIDSINDKS